MEKRTWGMVSSYREHWRQSANYWYETLLTGICNGEPESWRYRSFGALCDAVAQWERLDDEYQAMVRS